MSTTPSIPELIARIRQGDQEAAVFLVREYEAELRTVVRFRLRDARLRQVVDSIDLCQSILGSFFVRLSLGQYDLNSTSDLIKLLTRMACNKVVDVSRHQYAACRDQRRKTSLDETMAESVVDPQPLPGEQAALSDLRQHCREQMTPLEQEISTLRAEGHSWPEIGRQLGRTPDAARKMLDRAFDRISQEMNVSLVGSQ